MPSSTTAAALAAAGAACCLLMARPAAASEATHTYEDLEDVPIWLSKVGPYHNPQEVYSYYSLPFCRPESRLQPETRLGGLGEILEGNELQNSDLPLRFKENVEETKVCVMGPLDEPSAQLLAFAVSNHYWYQLFIDELPIWGMVGEILAEEEVIEALERDGEKGGEGGVGGLGSLLGAGAPKAHGIADLTFLYTHRNLTLRYNGDRIVEATLVSERPQQIEAGRSFTLSYSVRWEETDLPFERRMDRYLESSFFEHRVRWFSLFNAFLLVAFLCGLVALILMRTLRADFARYLREEDGLSLSSSGDAEMGGEAGEEGEAGGVVIAASAAADDSGWKQCHGDIFRRPPSVRLYSALLGTGVQLLLLAFIVVLSAFAGSLYLDRGAVMRAALVAYALTSAVSGFISGRFYRQQFLPESEAPDWIGVMLLSAGLFPACLFGSVFMLNLFAVGGGLHNALSLVTLLKIFVLWLFISLPLNVAGTIVGRRFAAVSSSAAGSAKPPAVNPMPRPIPQKPWFVHPLFLAAGAGLLPFGAVFIETFFVLSSFWNYKFYFVYGALTLTLTLTLVATACTSIVSTYLLLNSEDHRWQWHAFYSGASPSIYVFLYSAYYFLFRTEMSGFLQTLFYFGYTALACAGFGVMLGTVGVFASRAFVRAIFSGIKMD